jgi:hypothetical protein
MVKVPSACSFFLGMSLLRWVKFRVGASEVIANAVWMALTPDERSGASIARGAARYERARPPSIGATAFARLSGIHISVVLPSHAGVQRLVPRIVRIIGGSWADQEPSVNSPSQPGDIDKAFRTRSVAEPGPRADRPDRWCRTTPARSRAAPNVGWHWWLHSQASSLDFCY